MGMHPKATKSPSLQPGWNRQGKGWIYSWLKELWHKEAFPGPCRDPPLHLTGEVQTCLSFVVFLCLFNKEMHSERELFCEKATFNINCFASVAKLVNCIFSLCFPLMLKGSWLSVTKKEPCSSSTIALREIINKVCPGWESKWVNLPLWLLIFFVVPKMRLKSS